MPSLNESHVRHELARNIIGQVADGGCVLFKLKYIGSGTVTSVIVTTATHITLVSAAGGTTFTDTFNWAVPATYVTVQALVNAINNTGRWEARTMDALTTTTLGANYVTNGTLAVDAAGEYNVMSATAVGKYLAYRLSYDRTFGNSRALRNGHRVSLREIVTSITCGGGADANSLKVYECTPPGNNAPYGMAEILVLQRTPTSGAAETIYWASGKAKITAEEGNDLLVIITDAGSITGSITINGELE
jgi:hypothetical protein